MTKKDQSNIPLAESFTQKTTRLNINLLYSCMLKRIAKGFSSMDVSFLMGFSFDYVKDVEENMMNSGFEMVASRIYLDALSDTDTGGILFDDFEMDQVSKFNMVKTIFLE